MSNLAETILRDVKRYSLTQLGPVEGGQWLHYPDVLAALTAAMDPALTERAGEVLSRLRKADEYEPLGHDGWEAADLITALLTANAALRAERDVSNELGRAFEQDAGQQRALAEAAEAQIAALTARVEGLTGALRDILDTGGRFGSAAHMASVDAIARAALSATTEEGK